MFPTHTWYVACTADEIDEKPLGRTICNQAIVFYRAHEGKVAAVEDFCPHRGAPLSLGYVCEGKLVCGYHGLEMGCDGKTIDEAETIKNSMIAEELHLPPVKIHCSVLAEEALKAALEDYVKRHPEAAATVAATGGKLDAVHA